MNINTLSQCFSDGPLNRLRRQACRLWGCRHPQILSDQLSLSQPGGTDYAQQITTGTPGLSDLPTALEGA